MSPVIYTEITNPAYSLGSSAKNPTFKLSDLFLNYEQLSEDLKERNIFKVRFYCLRIDPQDTKEIVQAMCPSCKECYSCKDLGKEGIGRCKLCDVETKLVYKMQLLVKDASSQMNKNFYRLILFSGINVNEEQTNEENKESNENTSNVSNFFTGMPNNRPCNLYKNEEALAIIDKHIRLMLRYNVWIDALIERKGTYYLIKDTQIKKL